MVNDIWTRAGRYRMTWSDFGVLAARLAAAVRDDRFQPDVICGVARGGLTITGYLATVLEVWRLHLVRVRRTVDDTAYAAKHDARLELLPSDSLAGAERVLMVDDVTGTGATAGLVHRHVQQQVSADVRLAVLAHNPRSTYRPHYRAVEVDDWVVFPWESHVAPTTGERQLNLTAGQ